MEQRLQLADIAAGLVRRNNMPAKEAEAFVRQFFDCIADNLFHDNIVKVKELGTFKVVGVEAREIVDINTGQRIMIEEHTKVSFTPDAVLRDAINKPFAEFQTVALNENTPLEAMEAFDVNDQPSPTVPAEAQDVMPSRVQEPLPKVLQEVEQPAAPSEEGETEQKAPSSAIEPQPIEGQSGVAEPQPVKEQFGVAEPQHEEKRTTVVVPQPAEEQPTAVENQPTAVDFQPTAVESQSTAVGFQAVGEQPQASVSEVTATLDEQPTETKPDNLEAEADSPVSSESEEPAVSHGHHGFWHIALSILLLLLFFVMGYGVGYYRPVTLPDWQHLFATETEQGTQTANPKQPVSPTTKPTAVKPQNSTAAKPQNPTAVQSQNHATATSPVAASTDSAAVFQHQATSRKPSEILAYPQVEGGEYYIVGIKATEVMKPGKTLLNISIKYYKSKDFVNYICTMNNIKNPDIVPLDMELKIPELKRK